MVEETDGRASCHLRSLARAPSRGSARQESRCVRPSGLSLAFLTRLKGTVSGTAPQSGLSLSLQARGRPHHLAPRPRQSTRRDDPVQSSTAHGLPRARHLLPLVVLSHSARPLGQPFLPRLGLAPRTRARTSPTPGPASASRAQEGGRGHVEVQARAAQTGASEEGREEEERGRVVRVSLVEVFARSDLRCVSFAPVQRISLGWWQRREVLTNSRLQLPPQGDSPVLVFERLWLLFGLSLGGHLACAALRPRPRAGLGRPRGPRLSRHCCGSRQRRQTLPPCARPLGALPRERARASRQVGREQRSAR
mgnify:CR=1 FL=1